MNAPWIQNQRIIFLLVLNYLRADGRTDRQTRCFKGDHFQKVMQRIEVQSHRKKACVVDCMSKIRQNWSETLIAVPGSTVTYSRLNRKYNICAFTQEIHVFEGWFFVIWSNIVLASEWTTSRNQFVLYSIDFDRFMTSEGTDALILAFTSKTGQSVAR